MESTSFGLTRADLRGIALNIAMSNNLRHPLRIRVLGWNGVNCSYNDIKHGSQLDSQRILHPKENVSKFYDNHAQKLEKMVYTPDRTWNVDETVQSKVYQIILLWGKREIAALASAKRGRLITVIANMNATLMCTPSFFKSTLALH